MSTPPMFESDVIPDSGKTTNYCVPHSRVFESDVIPDSGKTHIPVGTAFHQFE